MEFELKFCDKCFQMTNHISDVCQKCLIVNEAKTFCENLDELEGEAWSNDYEELPNRLAQFAKSDVVKKFHTQGLYTEEDLHNAYITGGLWADLPLSFKDWFKKYKKK